MRRLLSTYLFVSRKLTRELLGEIAAAAFQGVEIFCSRAHFDYTNSAEIRAIVNIGPVGTAIRNTIVKSMPEIPAFTAHRIAKQILHDLTSRGMVAENAHLYNR